MGQIIKKSNYINGCLKGIKPTNKSRLLYNKQANSAIEAMDMNKRTKHVDAAYDYLSKKSINKWHKNDLTPILFGLGWLAGLITMYVITHYWGIM